jgi:hypothetical protein
LTVSRCDAGDQQLERGVLVEALEGQLRGAVGRARHVLDISGMSEVISIAS